MIIYWSDQAKAELKMIFQHYHQVAGSKIVRMIVLEIIESSKQLNSFPEIGQIEEYLLELSEGHRYLVIRNFKLIYKRVDKIILITDIFDTRQNPIRLLKRNT